MSTAIFEKENWEALRKTGKTFGQNSLDMILKIEEHDITIIPVGKINNDYLIEKFKHVYQLNGYLLGTTADKPNRNIYVPRFQGMIGEFKKLKPAKSNKLVSFIERIKKGFR
jgi:hypothetical protein